jgi:hypothetical protein
MPDVDNRIKSALEKRLRQILGFDCRNQELPQLMQRPEVRVFAEERVSELNAKAADLRQRIERQVGSMEAEAAEAQLEADRIASLLREVQP